MIWTRRRVLGAGMFAIVLIAASARMPMPWFFLYNPTESAPRGWYFVEPAHDIHVDDFVVVRLPFAVAQLAAARGYLPRSVPLLKHVAATAGQAVCVRNSVVFIDGQPVAIARARDSAARRLSPLSLCRAIRADELFLLSRDSDASFDSRYFGPVMRSRIFGRARPLWTW